MTTVDNINQTIRERNTAFDSLDDAGKRLAIARDVIQQVLLERFIAEAGTYVQDYTATAGGAPLVKCNVCAIGAVAVSLAGAEKGHEECRSIRRSVMADYFDYDQLREMEAAFEEQRDNRIDDDVTARDYIELWDGCYTDKERLCIVFANVINNGGRFVPETLENEIEAYKRTGVAGWYELTGMALPVSGQ